MSDSEEPLCGTERTQQLTPKKRPWRARRVLASDDDDDDDDDEAAFPVSSSAPSASSPSQAARPGGAAKKHWSERVSFKGRLGSSVVGQKVAVTYVTDEETGLRQVFIGTVVNISPSEGLRVRFESDDSEEWVHADNGDEWEW